MERLVLFLCGFWLWITRRRRSNRYSEVADTLHSARTYLISDYTSRASTRDRGGLLPDQMEALTILDHQLRLTAHTSRRFHSLAECCKLVTEELGEPRQAA